MINKLVTQKMKIKLNIESLIENKETILILLSIILLNQFSTIAYIILIFFLLTITNFRNLKIENISYFYIFLSALSILQLFLLRLNIINILISTVFNCTLIIIITAIKSIKSLDQSLERIIKYLFIINFVISISQLVIIWSSNNFTFPYWIENSSEYGMSTGDNIKGIFNYTSYYNAIFNVILLIYFKEIKSYRFQYLSLFLVGICTSNLASFMTIIILVINIFKDNYKISIIGIIIFGLATVIFSMKNIEYVEQTVSNLSFNRTDVDNKSLENTKPTKFPNQTHNSERFNAPKPLNEGLKSMISEQIRGGNSKLYSLKYNFNTWSKSIWNIIMGYGPGNFSSKLAFRASGNKEFGNYPTRQHKTTEEFKNGDLRIYNTIKSMDNSFHSIRLYPFSGFTMLIGEFGIFGLLAFFYFIIIKYFDVKNIINYCNQYLLILVIFSLFEYTFETIPLMVVFSILLNKNNYE